MDAARREEGLDMTVSTTPPTMLLEQAIKRIGMRNEARQLFNSWPTLKLASLRLCVFITPFIEVGNRPLLDLALERAITAARSTQGGEQVCRFIRAVATIADELCQLQVSLQDRDNDWEIWDFDKPMLDWMRAEQRDCLQVRRREDSYPKGPVTLALLSRVFSIRDLMKIELEVVA
jgi:hypothetical protein